MLEIDEPRSEDRLASEAVVKAEFNLASSFKSCSNIIVDGSWGMPISRSEPRGTSTIPPRKRDGRRGMWPTESVEAFMGNG